MDLYVAIPKAIIDIYSNGLTEKSESLGLFCVKPEIKKNILGKPIVIGFKEAITGEKIVNRIPYETEYRVEYEDVDCMIKGQETIGDLSWEIVDKATADRLLSPEELKKYMSLSAEEVNNQLQSIREKALNIGQTYGNLESNGIKNNNINDGEIYVAIPKAIIDIYSNGLTEKSESLGLFCVKPEIKKNMLGKPIVIGFKEAITGEKIVNRIPYETEYRVEYEDVDCMIKGQETIGDLSWEIVDKATADRLLPPEELKKYMSLSAEEVNNQLQSVREKALNIGQTSEKSL